MNLHDTIQRLLVLAWKETVQLRRDTMMLRFIIGVPLMQFLVFAFAINTEVRHAPLAVLDHDHSPASRELLQRLVATGSYDLAGVLDNEDQAEAALAGGQAAAVLVIPPRFGAERSAGHSAEVQVRLDASDPISVGSGQSAISGLILTISEEVHGAPPVNVNLVTRYNPEASTAVYIVPGLVGVILSTSLMLLTAIAVARERERGTLEALFASPVQSWEIIVGKLLPGVVVGYLQMVLILGLGAYFFHINPLPVALPMAFVGGLFIAANLAIGLLISTAVQTQAQAMQLALLTLLPNILLSGFMFPVAAMPTAARWFAECLPLTHFLRVDRGLLLKDADLAHLTGDVIALAVVLGALMFLAA
ncbi:MAG TPA: ABC transporter permease [Planctomycetota bacterium]|nr:ABC transporter permease [Planctomycetota bacterium]